ncbi:uncharacterized protein LOC132266076 [Phlebotomus argentipes]|uniref:uncharacterized protein LOC132266076 n=1 Tax=Phlebotomus argentipes TaxID=94469 RepID=UPI002892B2AC|nr:uncharacterized protein LOC132266076 [Phlebotomus argentipes]
MAEVTSNERCKQMRNSHHVLLYRVAKALGVISEAAHLSPKEAEDMSSSRPHSGASLGAQDRISQSILPLSFRKERERESIRGESLNSQRHDNGQTDIGADAAPGRAEARPAVDFHRRAHHQRAAAMLRRFERQVAFNETLAPHLQMASPPLDAVTRPPSVKKPTRVDDVHPPSSDAAPAPSGDNKRDSSDKERISTSAIYSSVSSATTTTTTTATISATPGVHNATHGRPPPADVSIAGGGVIDEGEQIIIIAGDGEEEVVVADELKEKMQHRNDDAFLSDEPKAMPLRPIIRGPFDDEHQGEVSIVYAEQHSEVKVNCEVDMDIVSSVWSRDDQIVHTMDRNSRPTNDYRFIREPRGGLTITNVMLEDDGKWQCEAKNARGYVENARPVKLVVLDRPKPPYLLIDSRRLDAGNIFVPVKENSELSLACISEGGNPKPVLTWEILLSPGVDRHAQKVTAELTQLQEVKNDKLDREPYRINSGAISEAKLPTVYRAHHNARILCVMEHPTLKIRQNASLLLDVQYTPSFAISRTPGFGYPLREGIEVSLKCDVDSNPPSTPVWQKDDGDTPVPQPGDGFLNFTSIRREHSGWYKCTSRHLNFQYSSIGYYLSVRYDSVDVTSEPIEQEMAIAASHNPYKPAQLEVQLGGAVTLQCPQGSLGCWSQLDPVTARLKGLGAGLSTPTGQSILKDVVYQDAGVYKCIGQSPSTKKKLEVLHTVAVAVKGPPTAVARNATPVAYPGSPLHLSVEFCANPPAFAARWLHGDRVYTPGNQYGIDVLAYGVIDVSTPFCKEARLTYVHMHERVPRTFYFVVSSPGGVAEAIFNVNFTLKHKTMSNSVDDGDDEELSEPEEIHFPVFGSANCCPRPFAVLLALPAYIAWQLVQTPAPI